MTSPTSAVAAQLCAHTRDGVCWLCCLEGEGPSWWRDVPGYGAQREARLAALEPPPPPASTTEVEADVSDGWTVCHQCGQYIHKGKPYWLVLRYTQKRGHFSFAYCERHLPEKYKEEAPANGLSAVSS